MIDLIYYESARQEAKSAENDIPTMRACKIFSSFILVGITTIY